MDERIGSRLSETESTAQIDSSTIVFLLCGLAAPFAFLPFVLWSGFVTPGYSHVSSTFSDAAAQGQPFPAIIGSGLVLLGVLLGLYGLGLSRTLPRCRGLCRSCLTVAAIAIAGTGIFQDHNRSPWVERNLEGTTHNAFAMVAILGIVATIGVTVYSVWSSADWQHLAPYGLTAAVGTAVSGIAFLNVGDGRDGIAERVFALIAIAWLVLMATNGLRIVADRYGAESSREMIFGFFSPDSLSTPVTVRESEPGQDR